MNRQQKYEPLAQRDEVIILDPMTSTTSYNYNSATPNSVPSSITPSIISHTSPPPSFHTHSSPGTPRPQHSFPDQHHQWSSNSGMGSGMGMVMGRGEGGGPPSSETEVGAIGSSNDALATIKGLKQRVEWLEESMGRLLLEKERRKDNLYPEDDPSTPKQDRNNCCVSFTDMSPDLERAVLANRQNCFVAYNGSSRSLEKRKDQRILLGAGLVLAFMICTTVATIVIAT